MKPVLNIIITIVISIVCASAQFRSDIPASSIPTNINGELNNNSNNNNYLTILDPSRFSLQQSFAMSIASNNRNSFSTAGFTNHISYMIYENLKLDADITIYKSQVPLHLQNNLSDAIDLSYNAGITYQPTKNSFLTLRFQKIPYYQRYQNHLPFNMRFIE